MPHYKATFVRKYYGHGYDAHMVYLVYTYRGHEYTVEESSRAAGSNDLAWQHRFEQDRIDEIIEWENRPKKPYRYEDTADYAFDQFLRYVEGEPSIFD